MFLITVLRQGWRAVDFDFWLHSLGSCVTYKVVFLRVRLVLSCSSDILNSKLGFHQKSRTKNQHHPSFKHFAYKFTFKHEAIYKVSVTSTLCFSTWTIDILLSDLLVGFWGKWRFYVSMNKIECSHKQTLQINQDGHAACNGSCVSLWYVADHCVQKGLWITLCYRCSLFYGDFPYKYTESKHVQ